MSGSRWRWLLVAVGVVLGVMTVIALVLNGSDETRGEAQARRNEEGFSAAEKALIGGSVAVTVTAAGVSVWRHRRERDGRDDDG